MKTWNNWVGPIGCLALITGCLGGQTGEVGPDGLGGQSQCPIENDAPLSVREHYQGTFETAYADSDEEFTCLPVAGHLSLDVRFIEDEDELELKPCGAAWYPVKVQLHAEDESLNRTLSGYLSEDGRLELNGIGPISTYAQLDAQQRTLTFRWQEPPLTSVKNCCEEAREQDTDPFAVIEESGVLALQTSSDHLGVNELHLAFSITADDTSSCLDTEAYFSTAVNIAIMDEDHQLLTELAGTARGQDGKVLGVWSETTRVRAFNAPELTTESQSQIFGLHFEATIPLSEGRTPTVSLNLDVAQDNNYQEILFHWEGKP